MSIKRNNTRAAQLGLLPSSTPVFLGGGIPVSAEHETDNTKINIQKLNDITLDQEITNNIDHLHTEDKVQSKKPRSTHQPTKSTKYPQKNQTRHKSQVDAFIDRLTLGQMQPTVVPPAPKTHSVTITLPCTTFTKLNELAGLRQAPALLRDAMLRLVAEAAFQFKIEFRTTIAQSRNLLVIERRKARTLGNEGIRFITIHMTVEESLHLVDIAREFNLAPNQLMEVLAYELVQSNLDADK